MAKSRVVRMQETWAQVRSLTGGQTAVLWCKRIAWRSNFLFGAAPSPGPSFAQALLSLDATKRQLVALSLTYAENHYKNQADLIRTVGLPALLGILVLLGLDNRELSSAIVFLLATVVYALLYFYFRRLSSIASTAVQSFHMIVVELHKP
ncbi:hypothetical protein FYJ24_04435 [Actinomycetaceae bacterium WB03_NA08]|uniref:Uncharacterized protein n=1 Tax=Scrofimicrobium canadense TaxID=2652290 RepID=A0A6N7VQM1_9ACTO|nr:hypothetical protein [Scrofimicrobium canadense]MSS84024.1 hypothetical protein [Scrofimicrobium canadense]